MISFKSIVVFDLETTGLPHLEHNKTKITEMSLFGCLTEHCHSIFLPRVLNKLTLCVNPMKPILPVTSQKTGLHNELLEEMKQFDNDTVLILNKYFETLPEPICLIAHNGYKFDFPIIRRELQKCTLQKLNEKLYCADSLLAFKSILPKRCLKIIEAASCTSHYELPQDDLTTSMESWSTSYMCDSTPKQNTQSRNILHSKNRSSKNNILDLRHCRRKLEFSLDSAIESQLNNEINDISNYNNPDLYMSMFNNSQKLKHKYSTILKSYKLEDIYKFLHEGESLDFHRSENDCLALVRCILKCHKEFLDWLPSNACLLSEIEPLL